MTIKRAKNKSDGFLIFREQTLHAKYYLTVACFLWAYWLAQITVFAETPLMQEERIILLNNRQVLRGEIALYGNRYLITQANSEIRLPREQVARICQNIQEAYLHLQHQSRFGSASDHLRLAQWCLDEGLFTEAQRQLEEGTLKRPNHPRIDLIRRQLEFAKTKRPTPAIQEPKIQSLHNAEELEELFDQMPPGMVESFTRVVQPLLLNSCSARGCHGIGGDNQFLLHRSARGQQPSRRITLRNLHSVLQWIDSESVSQSPLLHFAETPHSPTKHQGSKKTFFAPESLPARRLSAWVNNFSKNKDKMSPPILANANASPSKNADRSKTLFNWAGPVAGQEPSTIGQQTSRKKPEGKFRPRDPFDPQIFNQRHHPEIP